jgi:hypothetical protein
MRFLDESSLPPDLQGSGEYWKKYGKEILSWIDLSQLPLLPIGDGWIDPGKALQLTHDEAGFREALKSHSSAGALDRFSAAICSLEFGKKHSPLIAIARDIGGPETARALATALTRKTDDSRFLFCLACALEVIGDVTALPSISLAHFRLRRGPYANFFQQSVDVFVGKLGISPPGLEDWSVPDEGDPGEIVKFRQAQARRLQKAMLTNRRWTVAMFDRRIVRQPVIAPLAAGLVWGYYNQAGQLIQPFVIGPGFEYPAPPAGASVGVVHPVHLPSTEAAHWRERAKALKAPFDQWSVPAHNLSTEDLQRDRVPRLPDIKLPAATFLCRLEALGWQRTKDRTLFQFHRRPFPELGVRAVIRYTGIPLTYGAEWPDQSILECFFTSDRQPVPLSQVNPIAISAVLADLQALSAKPLRG